MERCRMVFSGSGGQGVITAAIVLAEAAVLHEGLTAVQSQAYGPEARGGATRRAILGSGQSGASSIAFIKSAAAPFRSPRRILNIARS